MSGSAVSPFATLGSTPHPSSPFGALGSTTTKPPAFSSGFGSSYGPSGFGSLGGKAGDVISSAPKLSGPIGGTAAKPFGAPDDDDEKTDDENGEGSGVEAHKETSSGKETFTQQESTSIIQRPHITASPRPLLCYIHPRLQVFVQC